ncbi:hypothetical protein DFH11DRAFT_1562722 [Phellopilus nigrolimitatus]|nr:hypothetical protein DFH11DRAFT_1562722 [Phellopilus nigrolimitatus]
MAYAYYAPGTSPQYLSPVYLPEPPPRSDYGRARPLTPHTPPPDERKRLRKERRWSFAGNKNLNAEYYYPNKYGGLPPTPPATPVQPRRVLWLADFMRAPVSTWYPALHPVLAADTSLVNFDARVVPRNGIDARAYTRFRDEPATMRPTLHLRLISQDFPWVFDIDHRAAHAKGYTHYVTCGDVWKALCNGLAGQLLDAEWTLLLTSKGPIADKDNSERKRMVERIIATRQHEVGRFARRVDWLGRNVMFRGLVRNEDFARKILLPGREPCTDTYIVKFAPLKV